MVDEKKSDDTALEPVANTIECAINYLSKKELIELNRRIRLFRVCISILYASISLLTALYHKPGSYTEYVIHISASSEIPWHIFQKLVLFTVLVPLAIIYWLSLGITFGNVVTTISRKAETRIYPGWVEILVIFLPMLLTITFLGGFGFDIL